MNAGQWQRSSNPCAMLEALMYRATLRKLRLFVCACCRYLDWRVRSPPAQDAVTMGERAADRLVPRGDMADFAARMERGLVEVGARVNRGDWVAHQCVLGMANSFTGIRVPFQCVRHVLGILAAENGIEEPDIDWRGWSRPWQEWSRRWRKHPAYEACVRPPCDLLREVFGNPYRKLTLPRRWPAPAEALARAVYDGEDAAYALHDALLDAGLAELSRHFEESRFHPKGCWVVDAILKKR
jgi:hypothetical protein